MSDSAPRGLRWRILWSAAAYTLCAFLGQHSAVFVGLLSSHANNPAPRVLRSATASPEKGKGKGDSAFEPGQEVILIAPPALAGTKATIVEPAQDGSNGEAYRVQLSSGSFFNIPVQNLECSGPKGPNPENTETSESSSKSSESSSQSSESSSPKDPKPETESVSESSSKSPKSSTQSSESSSPKDPKLEPKKVSESSSKSPKSSSSSSESSSPKDPKPETEKVSESSSKTSKSSSKSSESSSPTSPKSESRKESESLSTSSESSRKSSETSSSKGAPKSVTKTASESAKSTSQSSKSSRPKAYDLASELRSLIAGVKRSWSKLFSVPTKKPVLKKVAPAPPASPAPLPAPAKAKPASSQQAAPSSKKDKREEFFAKGQQVTLLYPPALAGNSGTIVAVTRRGDYAVQLPSGSIFQVSKDAIKAATDSGAGGGGSGSVGGSGRGYGGGNGLPPSGRESKHVPEDGKGGILFSWKLFFILGILCAMFPREFSRMLQELDWKQRRMFRELWRKTRRMLWNLRRKKTYVLRRLDIRPQRSQGAGVGSLVAILCLALYFMFPQLLAWFKEHLAPLMSNAEAVVLGNKNQGPDGSGNTWTAVWSMAVLALVLGVLATEIFRLDWRSGEIRDEERQRSYGRSDRYF